MKPVAHNELKCGDRYYRLWKAGLLTYKEAVKSQNAEEWLRYINDTDITTAYTAGYNKGYEDGQAEFEKKYNIGKNFSSADYDEVMKR